MIPGLLDSLGVLLSQPVVAAALGLALGGGLFVVSRWTFRTMNAEDPARGLSFIGMMLIGRMLLATVALFLYHTFAPSGFLAFGLATAGSFLVMYTVELVRYAGLHRYARPVAGPRDGRSVDA